MPDTYKKGDLVQVTLLGEIVGQETYSPSNVTIRVGDPDAYNSTMFSIFIENDDIKVEKVDMPIIAGDAFRVGRHVYTKPTEFSHFESANGEQVYLDDFGTDDVVWIIRNGKVVAS